MATTKKKNLLKPVIEPGCIACGSCEFIAPEVFKVTDKSRVNQDADFAKNEQLIKEAVAACPVRVIKLQNE